MGIITEDFLLKNETAKKLYEQVKDLPIIDYHCHISPKEIYENKQFRSITEVWLGGDHYKWRLLRANGVEEAAVTGDADDFTKFQNFAEALSKCIGNPMYHWCHLELKRYFGYDGILNGKTAREVYDLCNAKLQTPELSVRGIIKMSNVKMIGTTDDPIDDLKYHQLIAQDPTIETKVCPSYRPDKAVNIEKPGFTEYIAKLSAVSGVEIQTVADVKLALKKRLDFFVENGCRATDHGLDYLVYEPSTEEEADAVLKKALGGTTLSEKEVAIYKTQILTFLAEEICNHGIVMQLHYNALRNPNERMFEKLGPDTGFDCMDGYNCVHALAAFLNHMDKKDRLPRTIVYSLNANDNEIIDSVIGSFQGVGVKNKVQHGSAWWYNDTKSGMEAQLKSFANTSILGNFIGMLTDSRSFLSYTRHEYFRRILCNLIGGWVEDGEYPADEEALKEIVQNISYYNAEAYFKI